MFIEFFIEAPSQAPLEAPFEKPPPSQDPFKPPFNPSTFSPPRPPRPDGGGFSSPARPTQLLLHSLNKMLWPGCWTTSFSFARSATSVRLLAKPSGSQS